ncbi:MAG TPA: aldose 1-epimerase family protein, partial [Acidimicrobiia bacterium]|nr:aldose 1-epimerase family protein [Acidimicrobiia bacterium]
HMTSATALPSGRQHAISAGPYRATVVEVSGGLRTMECDGLSVLDGYAPDEMCDGARGHLLIPWPNRVDHGRYTFAGVPRQLDMTEPARDCAIHGLARWHNWDAEPDGAAAVTMTLRLHANPGWPHVLDLATRYTLDAGRGLTVEVTATNVGSTPAPYGNGAHPYVNAGTPKIDTCTLEVPGATRFTHDDRGIPTGREPVEGTRYDYREPRELGDAKLDEAFTDLARDGDGRAWAHLRSPDGTTVSLWVDDTYPCLEVFTGDHLPRPEKRRPGLGLEPMTCPPNAFATGESLVTLEPGQALTTTWGIVATR